MDTNTLMARSLICSLILKIVFIAGITFAAVYFNKCALLVWYILVPFVQVGFRIIPYTEDK